MGRRSNNRRRASGYIDVYPADLSRGWRILRQVKPEIARNKIVRGEWRELFDDFGNFHGVQIVAEPMSRRDEDTRLSTELGIHRIRLTPVYNEPSREPVDLQTTKLFWGAPKS